MKRYSGVLVRHNNKVLLCKRSAHQDSLAGEWSIPCGSIEKNETPKEAAYREFQEETDKEINGSLDFAGSVKRMNREGEEVKGLMYVYFHDSENEIIPDLENAQDGEEHSKCGYFAIDELPSPLGNQLKKLISIVLK
jgi:ADP-ribose pyrophosphatase YjhB (NUDIX family)